MMPWKKARCRVGVGGRLMAVLHGGRLLAAMLVAGMLLAGSLSGCSNDETSPTEPDTPSTATTGPSAWHRVAFKDLKNPTGMAVVGDELLFCCGEGDPNLYTASLTEVFASQGSETSTVHVKKIDVSMRDDSQLGGRGELAQTGHALGVVLKSGFSFQDVAVQGSSMVFVAERKKRLVIWGNLTRDAAGKIRAVSLTRAFEVPGADRKEKERLNWDDQGPGISGLLAVNLRRRTEDLYVTERATNDKGLIRVRAIDRGGQPLDYFFIEAGALKSPHVADLSWHDGRFSVLLSGKRGALATMKPPQPFRTGKMGIPVPAPIPPQNARWESVVHESMGRMLLLSGGPSPELVWREPH